MKRIYKVLIALGVVGLVASAAHAWNQHHRGPDFFRSHVSAKVDQALDSAPDVSIAQRSAVHAAVDHVFDVLAANHAARGAEMQEAIALFEADRIDPAAVAAHRARKEAELNQVGDALVQALYDAHDALTAPQRQAIVAWAKSQHTEHGGDRGNHDKWMKAMIQTRVDGALDEIKATPEQRAKVNAAKDRVIAAFREAHGDRGQDFDTLLQLFAADQVDAAKIRELRAEHLQRMHQVGDAIVQSVTDIHDALSATQRQALVAYVKAHHPAHHVQGLRPPRPSAGAHG
jgi:Spy/CpxP family protein refolding chaperone